LLRNIDKVFKIIIGIKMKKIFTKIAFLFTSLLFLSLSLNASEHKVVIQVSSDDAKTQELALNNAVNLQKVYGIDNITVEVVAYGPGLSILTEKYSDSDRVKSLVLQDIKFSACENTMNTIKKKTGADPILTQGVTVVPAGVARIVQLQEEGYTYIRP
jgi:uncharacterized protein